MASHVRDYTAWEVIPPPAVDEACRLAKDEAALAVEQDCTVVWSSPAKSSLEPPRLRLTAAARERVRKRSNTMAYSSQVVMPEVIGNKRAGPALRDGTVLCPQWNQGLCINGDACPVAHRCAAVYRSGRVCGGHHPALECRSAKVQWVNVHTTPAPKPPARKRGGAAEGVTPKRVRRGQEPAAGDHRTESRRQRRGQLSLCPSRLLWTPKLALRCSTAWPGAGQLRGQPLWNAIRRHPHPLRPACAGTAPPLWVGGLAGLSFGPGTRSQEWSDSARFGRETPNFGRANRAVRGTRMPLQYPAPIGFTATESSHLHLQLPDGTTLCRHAQGQARASNRLRNAYSTSDRREAVAWQRPICDECFRRASASFWPVV